VLVSNVGEKATETNLPRAVEDPPPVKTFKSRYVFLKDAPEELHFPR